MRIDQSSTALIAAKAALDKHAEDVVVLDVRALSGVADFFVICTAASARQMTAMTEHIHDQLRQHGLRVRRAEGLTPSRPSRRMASLLDQTPAWVLMDCGDVVVHLFTPSARHFYQLERLWGDAPRVSVS